MLKRIVSLCAALLLLVCLFSIGGVSVSAANEDLAVTSFSWNTAAEITPGTPVTFSVTIKNGRTTINTPFTITFGTATQTFTTVTYNSSLNANASVTVKSEPWTAVAGDYMVAAYVNASGTIPETDKRNNSMQASLRVANDKLSSAHESTRNMLKENGLDTLIFSEDFNDLSTVDTENTGKAGFKWYVARPYGAKTLTTDDYSVKNGVMSVHNITPTYNYGLGTYNHNTRVGFTYNTGYMEIRLRIPRPRANTNGEKGVPAIWALPPEKLNNRTTKWVEMDWMEYWGINGYGGDYPDGFYTVCLHEQHLTGSTVTTHFKNTNYIQEGLGDAEWHVMGWLWQEGLFITYFDGVEVMRQTYGSSRTPDPITSINKGDASTSQKGVYSMLDTQYNPIIIGGSKDNPMELDYVRVWNGNRTAKPDVIEGEVDAEEFVSIYAADADGKPIKKVTEDNYGYLLAGEREWNTLSANEKASINAVLKKNGQPTFEQLVAQAKQVNSNSGTTKKTITTTTRKTTTTATTKRPTGGAVVNPTGSTASSAPNNTETTVTDMVEDIPDSTETTLPTAQAAEPSESGSASWLGVILVSMGGLAIGLIIAGIVLVAAVVVVIVLIVRKKKKQA